MVLDVTAEEELEEGDRAQRTGSRSVELGSFLTKDPLILVVDDDDVIGFRLAEGPGAAESAGADGDPLSNWHNPEYAQIYACP